MAPKKLKIIHVADILFLLVDVGVKNSGTDPSSFGDLRDDKGRGKVDFLNINDTETTRKPFRYRKNSMRSSHLYKVKLHM